MGGGPSKPEPTRSYYSSTPVNSGNVYSSSYPSYRSGTSYSTNNTARQSTATAVPRNSNISRITNTNRDAIATVGPRNTDTSRISYRTATPSFREQKVTVPTEHKLNTNSNNSNISFNSASENSQGKKNNKKDFKIPMSEVLMPSGIMFNITLPSRPKCGCKTFSETKFINIWRNGRLVPGEHQMLCDQMNDTIKQHVTGQVTSYRIISIQKVKNCCLWTKYRNRRWDIMKEAGEDGLNERMLFHGSTAADDIVQRGFDERHSDAGGMFGAGVYFAEHSSKSNQYVFGRAGSGCPIHDESDCVYCERKMLLCRVVLGRTLVKHSADKMSHPPPSYHSVTGNPHAFGLKYPEFIIYRGEQAYPEYLITYKVIG